MYCRKCAEEIPEGGSFCPNCGAEVLSTGEMTRILPQKVEIQRTKQYYVSSKNRNVALLLTFLGFFGFAGLQRLYVGRMVSGAIYLFTFGLGGLGTIYDFYTIANETFKDGDGYPLYTDSSMKWNYHRRALKMDIRIPIAIVLVFIVIYYIPLITNMFADK